jgi:hypothetical protein
VFIGSFFNYDIIYLMFFKSKKEIGLREFIGTCLYHMLKNYENNSDDIINSIKEASDLEDTEISFLKEYGAALIPSYLLINLFKKNGNKLMEEIGLSMGVYMTRYYREEKGLNESESNKKNNDFENLFDLLMEKSSLSNRKDDRGLLCGSFADIYSREMGEDNNWSDYHAIAFRFALKIIDIGMFDYFDKEYKIVDK